MRSPSPIACTMRAAVLAATLLASAAALAQATPSGTWKTIDDNTGKPRGLVEITEKNGVYSGRLLKSFVDSDGKPRVCDKCTDARKDQPLIGMTILTGLRKTGDNEWSGGEHRGTQCRTHQRTDAGKVRWVAHDVSFEVRCHRQVPVRCAAR